MKLIHLEKKIAKIPVIIKQNKETLLCLNSNVSICDGDDLAKKLDNYDLKHQYENIAIISDYKKLKSRFSTINIKEPFWEYDFNLNLFNKFDLAKKIFLKQSDVKSIIVKDAHKYEFIILIIVDGLSYMDCKKWPNVRPCLVDTVTNTECGFQNIVGIKRAIAYLLFKKQFSNFIGFSYWDRDNELTEKIFKHCHTLNKIQRFSEIIEQLNDINLNKTYIQIVLNGLDGIAHKNRDEPLIEAIVQNIYQLVQELKDILLKTKRKGKIYLVSDHGILWKHKSNLVPILPDKQKHVHIRHYSTKLNNPRGLCFYSSGKNYTSLRHPFITRKMKSNEWGVHGGVSLQESIVPFFNQSIN